MKVLKVTPTEIKITENDKGETESIVIKEQVLQEIDVDLNIDTNALMDPIVRSRRNELLTESDKLVMPDRWAAYSNEQQQAISIYRQELRDLPDQPGYPNSVKWPTLSL
jgi:hypothetical protein